MSAQSGAVGDASYESRSLDDTAVVSALRARALTLIEEMLARLAAAEGMRPALDATAPVTIHEALVTQVMRGAVREVAAARGLKRHGGLLFDDTLSPLLTDPALRRALEPTIASTLHALSDTLSADFTPLALDGLPIESIGSLYEGLIAHGVVRDSQGALSVAPTRGRKRSGSYYTPRRITREVVARALAPAFARVAALPFEQRAAALLSLRLCDPAMGAGAFLVETARQVARELLPCRPDGLTESAALREVVDQCLFGSDTSRLAVAMAQVSLWMLIGDPDLSLQAVGPGLHQGDALVGLLRADLEAFPVAVAEQGLQRELPSLRARDLALLRTAADHVVGRSLAPRSGRRPRPRPQQVESEALRILAGHEPDAAARERAQAFGAFHWPLEMAPAAVADGFDAIIGNPPWVAFAGRAAQPLDPAVRDHFSRSYEAWRGYPTLHGLFVERASRLAPRGVVALVVPSPLADLDGYRSVRRALSRRHAVREPLLEFGQDAFDEVVQPCIALVADPVAKPCPTDQEWRLEERQHAEGVAARVEPPAILARLARAPTLPPEVFREMGFQTTSTVTKTMLLRAAEPDQQHQVPLLEGRNVREFFVGSARLYLAADPLRLQVARARFRPVDEYTRVDFVVRQTASVPIAALHSGLPFRNTLLAGFTHHDLSAALLVGLLNSALYRALHLAARRDARQAAFPQVKIAHLRELPLPPAKVRERERVRAVAIELEASARANGGLADRTLRSKLDAVVFDLFAAPLLEREGVVRFLAERVPSLGYVVG